VEGLKGLLCGADRQARGRMENRPRRMPRGKKERKVLGGIFMIYPLHRRIQLGTRELPSGVENG
jgi:hypothetical protein